MINQNIFSCKILWFLYLSNILPTLAWQQNFTKIQDLLVIVILIWGFYVQSHWCFCCSVALTAGSKKTRMNYLPVQILIFPMLFSYFAMLSMAIYENKMGIESVDEVFGGPDSDHVWWCCVCQLRQSRIPNKALYKQFICCLTIKYTGHH